MGPSVITALKVSATQIGGLDSGEVLPDFRKLSAILDAAELQYPKRALPAAYVGVFANWVRPRFNSDLLAKRIQEAELRPDVKLLKFETTREIP